MKPPRYVIRYIQMDGTPETPFRLISRKRDAISIAEKAAAQGRPDAMSVDVEDTWTGKRVASYVTLDGYIAHIRRTMEAFNRMPFIGPSDDTR